MPRQPSAAMRAAAAAAVNARPDGKPRLQRLDYVVPLPGESRPFEDLFREWLARKGRRAKEALSAMGVDLPDIADADGEGAEEQQTAGEKRQRHARSIDSGQNTGAEELGEGGRSTRADVGEDVEEASRRPPKRVRHGENAVSTTQRKERSRETYPLSPVMRATESAAQANGLERLEQEKRAEVADESHVQEGQTIVDDSSRPQRTAEDGANGENTSENIPSRLTDEELAEGYGLVPVEWDKDTGEADWLLCRFCATFGSMTRKKGYLWMHAWPFERDTMHNHAVTHHSDHWFQYCEAGAEGRKEMFENEVMPKEDVLAARIEQLKSAWGATRADRMAKHIKRKKQKEKRKQIKMTAELERMENESKAEKA